MKKVDWETLLKDKRIVTGIVVAFIFIIGVLIYSANRNRVLTKQNISYELTGKNGYGSVFFKDDTDLKIAKATAEAVGKKVGLSDSQIGVVTDSTNPSNILDGDTAETAYMDSNGDGKYHAFEVAIKQISIHTYVNGKLFGIQEPGMDLTTNGLKNGDKVTLKLKSAGDENKIHDEQYSIKVKGLKNPKKYQASQVLRHVRYTFSGISGTKAITINAKEDAWYKKNVGSNVPKPRVNKVKNGQTISIPTKKWAKENSNNIKIISDGNYKLTVSGLTELNKVNWQPLLDAMTKEAAHRNNNFFAVSDDSDDNSAKATLLKAYLCNNSAEDDYQIVAFYKVADGDDTQYKEVDYNSLKLKKGQFTGDKNIGVFGSSKDQIADYPKQNDSRVIAAINVK